MKTLKNNTLLYDKDCPLCRAYTKSFVSCGLLDQQGRCAYTGTHETVLKNVDLEGAKDEIALVDRKQNTVLYGIDGLIHIFTHERNWLKALLHFPPVYHPIKFCYFFVSYNRKLIAPSKTMFNANECSPSFNLFFRLLYLMVTAFITAVCLGTFIQPVLAHFSMQTGGITELLVVSGQLLSQGIIVSLVNRNRVMDYLGNMMTVSLIGGLLLIPAIIIQHAFVVTAGFTIGYLGLVVFTLFLLHIRRCQLLGLGCGITVSWILYRVVVLGILINV
ncbi:MAG TPA: DCC1-like thiol-disulfide oxidoreductase family protein [Flavobacteriales bacterium]|nr:DCC1-like thiol-disulfide oxidoreductase family protein [Flavobacteriales bacterium]